MLNKRREIKPEEVSVAIFCALVEEVAAVQLCLDETLHCPTSSIKNYIYTFGRIGDHHVVIALPNDMGIVNTANLAVYVSHAFQNVRFALMVGIGGGIPSDEKDIRLGDVAISRPKNGDPAVIPYDFVNYQSDNKSTLKSVLNKPHPILLNADKHVEIDEILDRSEFFVNLSLLTGKNHKYKHPGTEDILYDPKFCHVEEGKDCAACEKSGVREIVTRHGERKYPKVHRGLILSGNGIVKDADKRHELCRGYDKALCFEMEAAGIMDEISCLVIRGICDYCDTHKQDGWYYYAAAVAAAYMKTILLKIPGEDVEKLQQMSEALKKLDIKMDELHKNVQALNDSTTDSAEEQLHSQISEWLSPLDFIKRKQDILRDHIPNTVEWFFKTDEAFLAWCNGTGHNTLYVEGNPGAGKSMLASLAADHLSNQQNSAPCINVAVISAYYDYKTPGAQNCAVMVAGILKQFLRRGQKIHPAIRQLHNDFKTERTPSERDLFDVLLNVIQGVTVFLIIDSLDECSVSNRQELKILILGIQKLAQEKSVDIRLLATSRPSKLNEQLVGGEKTTYRAREEDLLLLLERRIGSKTDYIPDDAFWIQTKKQVASTANGIFLIAHLKAESMKIMTYEEMEDSLQNPEADLDKVYETSLTRINKLQGKKLELAQNLITWTVLSIRPLNLLEIAHALGVKQKFGREKFLLEIHAYLSLTQGLVEYRSGSEGVCLVHETASPVLRNYVSKIERFGQGGPQQYLASRCLTCLSLDESGFCQTDNDFEKRLRLHPLYDYAAHNWGHHAHETSTLNKEVIEFLKNEDHVAASSQALMVGKKYSSSLNYSQEAPMRMTGLHIAAYFGLEEVSNTLSRDKSASADSFDRYPLHYAAEHGHDAVVKLLLKRDTAPDHKDIREQTALFLAAQRGHTSVVELLLGTGKVNIDSEDMKRRTPLLCAVQNRHEMLVAQLLKQGASTNNSWIQINTYEDDGRFNNRFIHSFQRIQTVLSIAAEKGYDALTRLLLRHGANINEESMEIEFRAEWQKHMEPWKERSRWMGDLRVSCCSRFGPMFETPPWSHKTHFERSWTALHVAAKNGHENVVSVLLKNPSLEIDKRNLDRQTALLEAARRGRETIVQLLLDGGAEINTGNYYGWTPLHYAAHRGHEAIVKLLLDRGADVNSKNKGTRRRYR